MAKNKLVVPFLKWVGGKRQLIPEIKKLLPKGVANRPYYEPFIGGGALFFDLQPKRAVINDYNEELINVYIVIRDNPNELIEDLKKHKNTSEYFYEIRSIDRQPLFNNLTNIERASRIIYLNKTCYNGLYRVNNAGEFNSPFGKYKNPNIITCTSLTDQYEKLLKIIGIESKVITDGGHRYLRFYEEDGITWHTADLTNDLKNVQSGCQTSHFLQIDSEKLRDIDKRIGYISEKKGYTDDYFEQVKDFIIKKGLKGKAQLEYILEVFHLYVKPEKMGEHEL